MKYPISLDTALTVVGSLKVRAIKEKSKTKDSEEIKELNRRIRMYLAEERMLYGADEFQRLSVMDKVVTSYSPLIKKLNGFTES